MNVVNAIKVRGARVHNLKNINVDVPLNQIVGIAGISGLWLWAFYMPRGPVVIWRRCQLIPDGV